LYATVGDMRHARAVRRGTRERQVARVVVDHPGQEWSLLCKGVVLFEDGGALLADGRAVAPPASALRPRLAELTRQA